MSSNCDIRKIIVTVEGGLVQGVSDIPDGVEVEVRDYDTTEGHDVQVDRDGNIYSRSVWYGVKA